MKDVIEIHSSTCPRPHCDTVQLSLDGIQESKSSSVTTDAYSITFKNCSKVYPIRLIRPTNKYKYNEQNQILNVITDIHESSCTISSVVSDNPKRSNCRCALCHSASYACEYCEACAVLITNQLAHIKEASIKKKYELRRKSLLNTIEFLKDSPGSVKSKEADQKKIDNLTKTLQTLEEEESKEIKTIEKKRKLAWPFSTMSGTLRTQDLIKYTVNKIKKKRKFRQTRKEGL